MTALESLKELRKLNENQHWVGQHFATSHLDTIEKSLQALEIIKEKRVDTVAFIRCYVASNKRDEEIVNMYNEICADPYVTFSRQKKTITIEDCVLLKEVLL